MNEVVICGCGRGGHGVTRRLAARGVRELALLDDDKIERVNLPHLGVGEEWVGVSKARELATWASARGARVRWAETRFSLELLEPWHPCADVIYRQALFLALTDHHNSQLQVGIAGARLDTPVIAARVYASGGGDVVAQIDVDRDPCVACFTAFQRRTNAARVPLRGRDLPAGAGEAVDDAAAAVAMAILGDDASRRRMFAPVPGRGIPTAWEIPAERGAEPIPIYFPRDLQCPICGDAARVRRGSPAQAHSASRPTDAGLRLAAPSEPALSVAVSSRPDRDSGIAVIPLLVLMHLVPVVTLIAQGSLSNPGAAAAIPIWLAGFACGLGLWCIARVVAQERTGLVSDYLATPIPYLGVGFVLWLIFGFALYR